MIRFSTLANNGSSGLGVSRIAPWIPARICSMMDLGSCQLTASAPKYPRYLHRWWVRRGRPEAMTSIGSPTTSDRMSAASKQGKRTGHLSSLQAIGVLANCIQLDDGLPRRAAEGGHGLKVFQADAGNRQRQQRRCPPESNTNARSSSSAAPIAA